MSNKCFVTKLANSVDKDNLLKLGELRMRFKKPKNGLIKNILNGLESSSKVTAFFAYESEYLNFVDNFTGNTIGKYLDITNNGRIDNVNIQVSESYDKEYVDVSFIPFYYLTSITSQFSKDTLGFIDAGGNSVGFKPFKYTSIKNLSLDTTSFSGSLDDVPKTAIHLGFDETFVTGDISNLKDMVKMTYLGLRATQVTGDISNLKDIVGVTYLDLSKTQVTGDITELVNNMTKLKTIGIPPTVTITDAQKKTLTDRGCTITIA